MRGGPTGGELDRETHAAAVRGPPPLETGCCAGEALDRDLLTRRDVEKLFGVSRARAAQLMRTFGAELVGASRVLRRSELLRQLRKYRARAAFRGEEQRRARLVAELRQARLTGDPGWRCRSRRSRRVSPASPRA